MKKPTGMEKAFKRCMRRRDKANQIKAEILSGKQNTNQFINRSLRMFIDIKSMAYEQSKS